MSKPLPLITIQTFNQTNLQAAGAIFVQRVEAVSIGRGFLAGITGMGGGRNELMEKKMNDITQGLLDDLDAKARKTYPNAIGIVNANMDLSTSGEDASMMIVGQASATVLIPRSKPLVRPPLSPAQVLSGSSAPIGFSSSPPVLPAASMPPPRNVQLPIKAEASSPVPEDPMPMKGGSKKRTFLTKRLIKSSRKNRK
jgi:uncharacterized protein YbjQ (UPF0145 family)